MPKTRAAKRRPTTTATRRKAAAKTTGRKSAKTGSRRKPATSIRRRAASNGVSLEKFNSDLAQAAGKIHDKLLTMGPAITFKNPEPPEFYLAQLVKVGVISDTEADELKELADEVKKSSATSNARVEQLGGWIVKNGKRGPIARTIAGIAIASAKKAATTKLYSVAGADFFGAAIGGAAGAIAGSMIYPKGGMSSAIAGGVAGAILFGGGASAHEAGYL